MSTFSWDRFEQAPVVAILRGFRREQITPLVAALRCGGLTTMEVTMNSDGASDQIRAAIDAAPDSFNVGAGTVTDVGLLRQALNAGASFIVTPVVQAAVLAECKKRGVPIFPGALTPTEVCAAWERGADLVKIFPADWLGPAYIRRLKVLFPGIRLLPTGGIDSGTLPAYRRAGADGVGIGAPLLDRSRIEAGDWGWIQQRSRAFLEALKVERPATPAEGSA